MQMVVPDSIAHGDQCHDWPCVTGVGCVRDVYIHGFERLSFVAQHHFCVLGDVQCFTNAFDHNTFEFNSIENHRGEFQSNHWVFMFGRT